MKVLSMILKEKGGLRDLVQFLHQQLVIQQQKLSDSVELLKSGNLN